jgi:hypothetical protein
MEPQFFELTLEQQFHVRSFEQTVKNLTKEQAQDALVELYMQMLNKENMYKRFLMQQIGLEIPKR